MLPRRRLRTFILCTGTTLCVLIAVAFVASGWWQVAVARDAVQVIAYEVSDLYGENPGATAEEIDGVIRYLHNASVINLRIDPSGKAVDPFGTPFRAQHDQRTEASVTTVTSAGPDRRFGTGDDIRFVHEVVREARDGAP